jgi:FG-GAP-like repeat
MMRRRGFSVTGLVLLVGGVALAVAALGSIISLSEATETESASIPFAAGVDRHKTPMESQISPQFPSVSEISPAAETEAPAPTRTSFMAGWQRVSGAIGYRLDVSTDSSFSSYVNGYYNLDVGDVSGRVVSGLDSGTTYYYRVRAYDATGATSASSSVMAAATTAGAGLIIHATFDSSITTRANAVTIEATINRAIAIYESRFADPITIQIRFRYATTDAGGSPLDPGTVSLSEYVVYPIPWNTYISALKADAKTGNDNLANASLPATALSANIVPSSAGGRAVKLNTPPAMFANGTVGTGGPYDGIVTLNSTAPYQFTRPTGAGNLDAQRGVEHEIDEVIGLGSRLGHSGNDLHPQDLFSWSSPGVRNLSSSGTRYFSINRGTTNIVNFNQNSSGDFGDWLSTACPQAHPYVQNAFGCTGQYSDIAGTSPEGVNLDVIGYNMLNAPTTDVNGDGKPDWVLYNAGTQQTVLWYFNNNLRIGSATAPTLTAGYKLVGVADSNHDGHPDYVLFNPSTHQTVIWYLSGATRAASALGPALPSGWQIVATGDFNGDGKVDWVLYNASTRQTQIWYMNNNVHIASSAGPTLPAGYSLVGVADFNRDGHPDYLLFNSATRQSAIWYLSGTIFSSSQFGPTIASGYQLIGTADFNGDGKPDYLLYNPSTRQTYIWYLNGNVLVSSAAASTLPAGWSIVAP